MAYDKTVGDSEDLVVKKVNSSKDKQTRFPPRPKYGTEGTSDSLWANYVKMDIGDLVLYRYDISIDQEPSVRRRIQIVKLLLQLPCMGDYKQGIITDFRSTLLSLKKLENIDDPNEVEYRAEDEVQSRKGAKKYKVALKYTKTLSISNLQDYAKSTDISAMDNIKKEIVQALNILFNHYAETTDNLVTFGSGKIFPVGTSQENCDLGGGLEAIRGHFTSVRWMTSRFLLNVNVCRAAFYKTWTVLELMNKYRQDVSRDNVKLAFFLRGLRVRVNHLDSSKKDHGTISKIRTICGLVTENDGKDLDYPPEGRSFGATSKEISFWMDEKGGYYISVYDYFKQRYGISVDSTRPVINVGTPMNPKYLPPNLCSVLPGRVARTKLTSEQSQKMIDFCTSGPSPDASNIQSIGLTSVGLRGENRNLGRFHISFPREYSEPSLITVPTRVLNAPKVCYKSNNGYQNAKLSKNRSWDLRNMSFTTATNTRRWSYVVITFGGETNVYEGRHKDLEQLFKKELPKVGIKYTEPVDLKTARKVNVKDAADIDKIFQIAKNYSLNWLLIILPRRIIAGDYNYIKKLGDLHHGIATICVAGDKLDAQRNPAQYVANISMKLNLKLGGNNQYVKFNELTSLNFSETMVVGIDVTHPSPSSSKDTPSIAAVVATINSSLGQWPAVIRRQAEARQEMVSELADMLHSRLLLWEKHNKAYPKNILVYRDGVSEGQYETVLDQELPLLHEAFTRIPVYRKKAPRLTVIIVGKRHHTRFYAPGDEPSNPLPGTIVDRGVTEARYWDFYLQPHDAIKGTARPIHYFVLHDEIFKDLRNPVSELEAVTQGLCYVFGRATKPVSVCTPAYYADIACERARCYLDHLFDDPGEWAAHDSKSSKDIQKPSQGKVPPKDKIELHANIRDTMFYI
ncbi:Piwi-domain-containing protein [Daldinia vernicosa]|uniref:Piwi-domain-containing protein n=1 Tax=Daldinia vernicosa TaxID=114800 RepID=UPI0020087D7A|nr:Piwi-domain-containing protein [Daldinia vernicosa]KAI0849501.1 Piwi-domain-containing protein [Daldinia vernicosa]